jgi:DnaJ-class molecular chaperone
MARKNPYDLLGVNPSATDKEIQSAYRKLAKTLHPDVNPDNPAAAERFKEVTAAYNLLSNPSLRKQYDTGQIDDQGQQRNPFAGGFGGHNGGPGYSTGFGGFEGFGGRGGPMAGDDMADLFSSLFGMNMGGMRGGMGGRRPHRQPVKRKGADIEYRLTLSLPEALKGGMRALPTGTKVRIPAGVKDGQTLRIKGKGQPGLHGGPAGDGRVKINVLEHSHLVRDGDDLRLRLPISVREALEGADVRLDMPNGAVKLKVPPRSNTGHKMRLKGKGVNAQGNLIVELIVTLSPVELEQGASYLSTMKDKAEKADGDVLRSDLIGL